MIRFCFVVCVAALLTGCAIYQVHKGEGGHDYSGATIGVSGAFSRE
jgi:hypothetical protein